MMFRDNCRFFRDKLPLHAGRDLEPKLEKRVDAHLASCLPCFREFRALAESRAVLGVAAEERLPAGILDGFTEEVMARIAVDEPGPAAQLPTTRGPRPLIPLLSAAAALLMVATAAWRFFDEGGAIDLSAPASMGSPAASLVDMEGKPEPAEPSDAPRALFGVAPTDALTAPLHPSQPDVHVMELNDEMRVLLERLPIDVRLMLLQQNASGLAPEAGRTERERQR